MDTGLIMVTPLVFEIIIDHPVYGKDFVAAKWVYKSMRDMVSGSNTGFYIPAFGGTRLDSGVYGGVVILPFDYNKPKELPIGVNARIRVTTEGHIPPEGKFGTVTFYMDRIKL